MLLIAFLPKFLLFLGAVNRLFMLLVDSDVTYSENDRTNEHYDVSAVDAEQEECDHGERRACDRDAHKVSVKVLHGLFALEISDPENLIEHHENERHCKNSRPEIESFEIEIRE